MFTQDFIKDFDRLFNETVPFAFVRFHDGEHAILEGIPYRAASKWTSAGGDVWMRDELEEVLHTKLDRFYLGVSPPCCAPQATHYYRTKMKRDLALTTYATLFQFKNYRRMRLWKQRFKNILFIGSGEADIIVPGNGVVKEWDVDAVVDQMIASIRPMFVAAGPCANILIHRYWARQDPEKRQTTIDVGAAFDEQIHRQKTRPYHDAKSKLHAHECKWDEWEPFSALSDKRRRELQAESNIKAKYKQLADQGFGAPEVRSRNRTTTRPPTKLVKSYDQMQRDKDIKRIKQK